jgi:hypothetical protein
MFSLRRQPVVVAAVYEPKKGFFLTFNEKWGGYALPMRKRRVADPDEAFTAREALRDAVGLRLPKAGARPLEYLEYVGNSARTGRRVHYSYQAFEVEPNEALPAGGFGCGYGYLDFEALLEADLVTWSTKAVVVELVLDQQVALAVVCREGHTGREFLMVRSASYGGYFFPASRFKTDTRPSWEAVEAVRRETGYAGRMKPGAALTVEDIHFSPRFQRHRRFVFHAVPVVLPGRVVAGAPCELDECLARTGALWRWVEEEELADPAAHDLSPTVTAVRDVVRQVAAPSGVR